MSRIRNALTARERLAWYLLMVIVLLMIGLMHAHWRLVTVQKDFKMHIPPDVSQGALLTPDMPGNASVYMYTHYIWRSLNTWRESGAKDYLPAIEAFACYVSPDFLKWLKADQTRELSAGNLARTRDMSAVHFYQDNYVKPAGNGTWYVWLDMSLEERVSGEIIKDATIRYPLYAYIDQRDCNLLGVSVGGFFSDPERL